MQLDQPKHWTPLQTKDEQVIIDCWQGQDDLPSVSSLSKLIKAELKQDKQSIVVFCTLTPLILTQGPNLVSRLLSNLSSIKNNKVIGVVLSGCHSKRDLEGLRRLAQTSVRISEEEDDLYHCLTAHKSVSGKTEVVKESLKITSGKIASTLIKEKKKGRVVDEESDDKSVDKLTTFNLSLTDKEKAARDKLVLPFYKEGQKQQQKQEEEQEEVRITSKSSNAESTSKVGNIYYSPEEVDDWDEEDPDDDLDF